MNNQEIESILACNEDTLYAQIGESLAVLSVGETHDPEILTSRGQEWFQRNRSRIKKLVCENKKLISLLKASTETPPVQIAILIADALTQSFSKFPVFTIAALVIKQGIESLCKDISNDSQ